MAPVKSTDTPTAARLPRSRKNRPCDSCRRLKQSCRIAIRDQPCEACQRSGKECTFEKPPLKRHPSSSPGKEGDKNININNNNNNTYVELDSALFLPPTITIDYPFINNNVGGPSTSTSTYINSIPVAPPPIPLSASITPPLDTSAGTSAYNLLGLLSSLDAIDIEEQHLAILYPSLDMEYTDQEESHYLGPGAFSLLTLDNPSSQSGLCRSPKGGDSPPSESLVYRQVSDPRHPVFFLRNPSRFYEKAPGEILARQLYDEVLQILVSEGHDLATRLFQIFLDDCLPAMPMMNRFRLEGACHAWQGAGPFPYSLMVGILGFTAVAIPALRHRCRELWQIILRLVDHEYRQPRLQTLQLALMDIGGRPVSIPGGNHTAICRAIGAAQLLGLHKDCTTWKLPPWEKAIRKRIWWILYVHDKWNAFVYGRPSNIGTSAVPLPTEKEDDWYGDNTKPPTIYAFIAMCRISVILDKCLPMASDGEINHEVTLRCAKELGGVLVDLPGDLLTGKQAGYRSFQIHWHGLNLLIVRLGFDSRTNLTPHQLNSAALGLITVGEGFATFLETLGPTDFGGYWSSSASYQLSHAVVVLLRCAVRTHASLSHQTEVVSRIIILVERILKSIREGVDNKWEIAEAAWPRIKIVIRSLPPLPGSDSLGSVIERRDVDAGEALIITPETEGFYNMDGNGWLAMEVESWLKEFPGVEM